jgi:hypothetical protein
LQVHRNRQGLQLTGVSPTLTIRTPSGLGSVAHDTALGTSAAGGGYFTASFVGMTSAHADATALGGGEPEDRVFMLRTPYLRTGIRKTVDRVSLSVGGFEVIPPLELLPFFELRPNAQELVVARRRMTEALAAARQSEGAFAARPDEGSGRRLSFLPTPPSYCNARQLFPVGSANDFAFSGCESLTTYLINNNGGSPMLGARFGFSIGPISIAGGFSFTPTLVVGLIGDVCLEKWKLRFGFEVVTGVAARLYISGEIAPIAKAFLRLDGRALGLTFKPIITADAKQGAIAGRFDFGIETISLGVVAGIQLPTIKWCRGCTGCCGFDVCISYPCGFSWGSENSFEFDRISIGGDGRVRNLLASLGAFTDWSPPKLGSINLSQRGPASAAVKFADFLEEDSEILSTQLELRRGSPSGDLLFCTAFGGAAEAWDGRLSVAPNHGDRVYACLTSSNTHGHSASKCSEPLIWDAAAPVLQHLYTVNPETGNWRIKLPCELHEVGCLGRCTPGLPVDPDCEDRVYTNTSRILRFGMRLGTVWRFESTEIKSARWAISTGAMCASESCTDAESWRRGARLTTVFTSIGNSRALTLGQVGAYWNPLARQMNRWPMLEIAGVNLGLAEGVDHYFNLHLCDKYDNCDVVGPNYALFVDSSAPPQPQRMLADKNAVSSADGLTQYFIRRERIDPIWVFASYNRSSARFDGAETDVTASEFNAVLARRAASDGFEIIVGKLPVDEEAGDLVDPQSGAVVAYVDLYQLRPPPELGRVHSGRFDVSLRLPNAPLRSPPFLHANAALHGLVLELGASYVVELVQLNKGGGVSVFPSETIVADWTRPICTTPWLSAGPGEAMVRALTTPPGSTTYGGTRVHSWINTNATQVSVHVSRGVCNDPESAIHTIRMWVGTSRDGMGDVVARREVRAGSVVTLPITPLVDLKDRVECTQCGDDTVVGVECVNGAGQAKVCQRYASFRVGEHTVVHRTHTCTCTCTPTHLRHMMTTFHRFLLVCSQMAARPHARTTLFSLGMACARDRRAPPPPCTCLTSTTPSKTARQASSVLSTCSKT